MPNDDDDNDDDDVACHPRQDTQYMLPQTISPTIIVPDAPTNILSGWIESTTDKSTDTHTNNNDRPNDDDECFPRQDTQYVLPQMCYHRPSHSPYPLPSTSFIDLFELVMAPRTMILIMTTHMTPTALHKSLVLLQRTHMNACNDNKNTNNYVLCFHNFLLLHRRMYSWHLYMQLQFLNTPYANTSKDYHDNFAPMNTPSTPITKKRNKTHAHDEFLYHRWNKSSTNICIVTGTTMPKLKPKTNNTNNHTHKQQSSGTTAIKDDLSTTHIPLTLFIPLIWVNLTKKK